MAKTYITTAIPYVNAKPHIGHALEFVQADAMARTRRHLGDDVCLLSGGDENAVKNVQAAELAGKATQEFIDENTALFRVLAEKLNVGFDVFQKGSDRTHHYPATQHLWTLCDKAGDIYKQSYEGLYCVGCEAFFTQEELVNGECPEHPGKPLTSVREENYFFRLSRYQEQLISLIASDELAIRPASRKNEMLAFLSQPLHDLSVSRTNERAKDWGVPVPDDPSQRIYVWFDALNIYQSGIGFFWDETTYRKWWPADVHVIGKGISRFHAVYWPAFLLSAGLKLPKSLFIHGYFTVNGQKMSKTLGNVIDPNDLIDSHGADALRYYLLREISPFADGDFSLPRFSELYQADLANGIGNLISRLARLATQTESLQVAKSPSFPEALKTYPAIGDLIISYRFNEALEGIWQLVRDTDRHLDETEPWKKSGTEKADAVAVAIKTLLDAGTLLLPYLPSTAQVIRSRFTKTPTIEQPLFPRIPTD